MPKHIQAKCPDNGGDCGGTCNYCCLAICSVCGGAEGSLTTDCCGEKMGSEKEQEVYKSDLDYTDEKGWYHTGNKKGGMNGWPSPNFFEQCQTTKVTMTTKPAEDFEDYVDVQCEKEAVFQIGSIKHCLDCYQAIEREEGNPGEFIGGDVTDLSSGKVIYKYVHKALVPPLRGMKNIW